MCDVINNDNVYSFKVFMGLFSHDIKREAYNVCEQFDKMFTILSLCVYLKKKIPLISCLFLYCMLFKTI